MNHFFLWVGTDSSNEHTGKILLEKLKSVEEITTLRGTSWFLCFGAHKDGLGAYRNDRVRLLHQHKDPSRENRRILWFGHAWSVTDGNQPPISVLEKYADELTIEKLLAKGRENCDGVYALLLLDEAERTVSIASDLLGSFHVYYRAFPKGIAVSNSSAVLAGLQPLSAPDPVGVQELCSNAVPYGNRSIWCDVKKLRSGEILNIDTARPRIELISHRPLLQILNDIDGYRQDPLPELSDSMRHVLAMLQSSGGRGSEFRGLPWVADLTGGNDSRALMAAILAQKINVVSTVTGPSSDPDVQISESLAKKIGLRHFTRPPSDPISFLEFAEALSLTDGEFDAVEYAGINSVHRQHILDQFQFSVNGSYFETARGYPFRLGLPGMLFPDRVSSALCRRTPLDQRHPSVVRWEEACSLKKLSSQLFSSSARATASNYFIDMFGNLLSYAQYLPQHAQLDLIHLDMRMERWQGRIASSTNQLWPAISPCGFQSILKTLLTTAPQHRRNSLLTRTFTFHHSPALAVEPLFTGNPAMPFSLIDTPKFFPVVPFYARRAVNKIKTKLFPGQIPSSRTAADIQPELCASPEINAWINDPLLAATGLFAVDRLVPFLSIMRIQSDAEHRLWCRLLTVEAALRRQQE